jgi:hypothetical protein
MLTTDAATAFVHAKWSKFRCLLHASIVAKTCAIVLALNDQFEQKN